jgi:hypothetical protein
MASLVEELNCLEGLASGVYSYGSAVKLSASASGPVKQDVTPIHQPIAQGRPLDGLAIYHYSVVTYSFILLRPN